MACYVDTVRSQPGTRLRYTEYCHLLADTRVELHAVTEALGIPHRSFQDHPWRWPEQLRSRAVELGTIEITMHEVGALLRTRRAAVPDRGVA